MKKLLIGLGIGCGVIILGVIVAVMIGGYFVSKTVGDKIGDVVQAGQQMQKGQQELAALNTKYAWTAPPSGQPLSLDDDRLQAYLAVREESLPVYKDFETKADALNKRLQQGGDMAKLNGAVEGTKMVTEMMAALRDAYVKALDAHKMSPREFGAITGAIYGAPMGARLSAQRASMAQQLTALDAQIATADATVKPMLIQQRQTLVNMQAQLPAAANDSTYSGNAALLAKYKERVQQSMNPAFDTFIASADSDFGNQVNLGMGQSPQRHAADDSQ